MELRPAQTDNVLGKPTWIRAIPLGTIGAREGNQRMTEMFLNAFFVVRGFHADLLQRARTERGASMVEYALLIGLIAVVAVVVVSLLGKGIAGLFSTANNCVGTAGSNSPTC